MGMVNLTVIWDTALFLVLSMVSERVVKSAGVPTAKLTPVLTN